MKNRTAVLATTLVMMTGACVASSATSAFADGGAPLSPQVIAEKSAVSADPPPALTPMEKKIHAAKLQWVKNVDGVSDPQSARPMICGPAVVAGADAAGARSLTPQIKISGDSVTPGAVPAAACPGKPATANVVGNQQGQIYSNYCGPATIHEMLGHVGISASQSTLAAKIGITPGNGGSDVGTFGNVLNSYHTSSWHYDWAQVDTATTAATDTFKDRMSTDIIGGYSVAGDAVEVSGGPHLTGHPVNHATIYHWFDIRGYTSGNDFADRVNYEDSANTVWSAVPAYTNGFGTITLVRIVAERGYYW